MLHFLSVILLYFFLLTTDCCGFRIRREVHFPGYSYCGPGTPSERIAKNETGINGLDEACRYHDLVYDRTRALRPRVEADIKLENDAWARVEAEDSEKGEKTAAWIVANVMKIKHKLGTRLIKKIECRLKIDAEILDDREPNWNTNA
ncbi:uncharacterized protein LOC126907298 [Daktulosphaira vitifoliae]|uniref:uncharacterized protein LOC126907298 n=1 Tax=Daktulosphaira vitifoliae TaxID=58002 RepID=UPI0021A97E80|nr:uncharacterized protein LOC126907298 [Daktulosphaira vitifoliae]